MASVQTIRTLTVRGRPEGLDTLATALARVKAEHAGVAAAAETSARRSLSASQAWERLEARADPVARAYQKLTRDIGVADRALSQGVIGLDQYGGAVDRMRREIEAGAGIRLPQIDQSALHASLGVVVDEVRGAARDSAAAFEAEFARLDDIARMLGDAAGRAFQDALNDSFRIGGRSAAASGATFSALDEMVQEQAAIDAARRAQAEQTAQASFNSLLGVGARPATAMGATSSALAEAAAEADRLEAASARLIAEIDPLAAATTRLNAELAEYRTMQAAGLITTTQSTAAAAAAQGRFDALAKRVDATGKVSGLAGHQLANLSFQINDAATMALSGSGAFQILATQGGQVFQVLQTAEGGVTGSMKSIGQSVLGLLTPFSVAGAAAVAFGAYTVFALDRANRSAKALEASLAGRGRMTGATALQLENVATANAGTGGASVSEAREMAAAYASTGRIGVEAMGSLIRIQRAYAAATQQELPAATAELAKALADPAAGASLLSERLGILDDRTARMVERMVRMGDRTGAAAILQDRLGASLESLRSKIVDQETPWRTITRVIDGATDAYALWLNKGSVSASTDEGDRAVLDAARSRIASRNSSPIIGMLYGSNDEDEAMIREAEDRIKARADKLARDVQKQFDDKGKVAGSIARSLVPDVDVYDDLIAKRKQLAESINDPRIAKNADNLNVNREALARVTAAIESYLPPAEKARRLRELDLAAINARTPAERAEIEAARARIDAAGDTARAITAEADAKAASARVFAEANKAILDGERERAIALAERFASARLDLQSIGATAGETERLRYILEATAEARRQAFDLTGSDNVSAARVAQITSEADAWSRLQSEIAKAKLSYDLAFEQQQAGRSRAEQQVYSRLQSAGQLTNGEIVTDDAKRAAEAIRATQTLSAQAEIVRDLNFETRLLGETESERAVLQRMNSAGLLDQYGRISGATNQAIADQIRLNDTIAKTQAAYRGYGREALDALAKGDVKGVGTKMLDRTSNMFLDQAGEGVDNFISGAINQAMGGSLLGGAFAGKPDGSANKPLAVNVVNASAFGGLFGGAANDDYVSKFVGLTSGTSVTANSRVQNAFAGFDIGAAANALKTIESGGNYGALGPVTAKGDRAYGAYQVMGANIPSWTRSHLGYSMTPDQFLANPRAQDSVFAGQFGGYAQKYGPVGASRAWFAGEGGMNRLGGQDVLGTSTGGYGDRFGELYGQYSTQLAQSGAQVTAFGSTVGQTTPAIGTFGNTFESVGEQVANSSTGIAGAASSLNASGGQLAGAGQQAAGQAQGFVGGLGGAFQQILGGLGQIGSGLLNAVGSFIPGLGGGGGGLPDLLGSAVGSNPFAFERGGIMTSRGPVPLRTYSAGGIANSPQLAMFGEGSTPEAYVPVPSGRIPVEMRGAVKAAREQAAPVSTTVTFAPVTTITVGANAGVTKAEVAEIVARGNEQQMRDLRRNPTFKAAVTEATRDAAMRRAG